MSDEAIPETIAPEQTGSEDQTSTPPTEQPLGSDTGVLNTFGTFLLILVPTVVAGFIDFSTRGSMGILSGAVFVIACIAGAMLVRGRDLWTSVISPPLAYLLALVIAGQKETLEGTGQLVVREASLIVTGLALGAPWLFGGTLIALAIALVRRARTR